MDKETCPACGEGVLTERYEDGLHFSECNHCGSELANADQSKKNLEAA
jgi:uncharacterized protein (DUF983 family)